MLNYSLPQVTSTALVAHWFPLVCVSTQLPLEVRLDQHKSFRGCVINQLFNPQLLSLNQSASTFTTFLGVVAHKKGDISQLNNVNVSLHPYTKLCILIF